MSISRRAQVIFLVDERAGRRVKRLMHPGWLVSAVHTLEACTCVGKIELVGPKCPGLLSVGIKGGVQAGLPWRLTSYNSSSRGYILYGVGSPLSEFGCQTFVRGNSD